MEKGMRLSLILVVVLKTILEYINRSKWIRAVQYGNQHILHYVRVVLMVDYRLFIVQLTFMHHLLCPSDSIILYFKWQTFFNRLTASLSLSQVFRCIGFIILLNIPLVSTTRQSVLVWLIDGRGLSIILKRITNRRKFTFIILSNTINTILERISEQLENPRWQEHWFQLKTNSYTVAW